MNESKLTRRQFIRMAGGLTAATAVAGGVGVASAAITDRGNDVSRTTGRKLRSIPTTCQLCQSRCGMLAFEHDGQLEKVEGNPGHPNNKGRICAKGQAAPNLFHNPDRLLHPLKRAGARGEGKWKRISWSEALDEMANRLGALRANGRANEFVFQGGTMATARFASRFLNSFGTSNVFLSNPSTDTNKRLALASTWGSEDGIPDLSRSKYVLNFGSNPYETSWYHVPLVQRLIEARNENGCRLVTFDVRMSKTAGKSDEWYPVFPGTDGLVALSIANVIMEEGLFDEAFLKKWTNQQPDELSRYLGQFKPERTVAETGVPAEDLRRVARNFATSRPAAAITGTGVSMRQNGVQAERCVFLLNAITGNIDVPGGFCLPRKYEFAEPDPVPPTLPAGGNTERSVVSSHVVLSEIAQGKIKASVYMTYMFNPAYSNADNAASIETLKDEKTIPYFVAVDILPSETASLADLVLPDTTFLERWDLESGPAFDMVPFVSLRQPVVKSPGESVPFHDVCIELGRRIAGGMERYSAFSATDYLRAMANSIPGLKALGGLEYLKEHGVWHDSQTKPAYRSYQDNGFATPSKKLEIASPSLQSKGTAVLPDYLPIQSYRTAGENDLFLVTFKRGVLTSSLAASKWLSEISHDSLVLINSATASSLGIKNGDTVEIRSADKTITSKVRLTNGIHPRVIASPIGSSHWGLGRIAQGLTFKSDDPDTRLMWWKNGSESAHPNAVMSTLTDRTGKGQAWHDTVVSIRKVSKEA